VSEQDLAELEWLRDAVAHFRGRTMADLPGYKNESYGPWERCSEPRPWCRAVYAQRSSQRGSADAICDCP